MTAPRNLAELEIDELREIAKYLEFYKEQQTISGRKTIHENVEDTSLLAVCRANYLAKKNCFQLKEEIKKKKQEEERQYILTNISSFPPQGASLKKIFNGLKANEGLLQQINGYSFIIHGLERREKGNIVFVLVLNEKKNINVTINEDLSMETLPAFNSINQPSSFENWQAAITNLCKVIESS